MQKNYFLLFLFFTLSISSQSTVQDDFEGSGTISTWAGDDCSLDTSFANVFQQGINTSATVLKYSDTGGQYANVRFDTSANFDLSTNRTFSIKIYISSSDITGNQTNQISLKLQDGSLGSPWSTQSEIIKTVVLNQWQTITFDFANDSYINLDSNSAIPINRTDFNRVLLQVNGENNTDHVTVYIDDFLYDGTIEDVSGPGSDSVFDNLVWSDEFDGTGALDASKWFHQTQLPNGSSWYNGEIQHYTNRTANTYLTDGVMHLVAKKETFTDQGVTKQYTSARLNSKFAFTYGKVEVRAKLPAGVGTWPAIWMLGQNISENGGYWDTTHGSVNWPDCGEVDIIEHWGSNQNYVQSAMHTPSSSGGTINLGGQTISTASTNFHIYTLEWTSEKMVFKVDGVEHYTYNPVTKDANTWPFDAPQYLLLNIALQPGISAGFTESAMEIDYVRIYQQSTLSTVSFNQPDFIYLYPNPIEDKLTIKVDAKLLGKDVRVYSILGKEVKRFAFKKSDTTYDFSTLKRGVYFIKLEVEGKVYMEKVVKI